MKRLILVLLTICLVFTLVGTALAAVTLDKQECYRAVDGTVVLTGDRAGEELTSHFVSLAGEYHPAASVHLTEDGWSLGVEPWWSVGPTKWEVVLTSGGQEVLRAPCWLDVPHAPFGDVAICEDWDMYLNAWLVKANGWLLGYKNGTLGYGEYVIHRHIWAISMRAGLNAGHFEWQDDYTPITRGEVRDAIPGLEWDSDRWGEPLLRGQLVRLLGRTLQ